ncbi:MAG: hypothetical protein ChlgKO_06960 [Chlamydiales bacterium]
MSPEKFIHIIARIAIGEVVLCIIAGILIAIFGGWIGKKRQQFESLRQEIIDYILRSVSEGKEYEKKNFPKKYCKPQELLSALGELELKLADPLYLAYKTSLTDSFLFPTSRRWYCSFQWQKRNFAARTFAYVPQVQDEKRILQLLRDKIPLNRLLAAQAGISIGSDLLLRDIVEVVIEEPKRAFYAYRDLFLNGDKKVFDWISSEIKHEKNPAFRCIYLDIFHEKSGYDILQYIHDDLTHPSSELRFSALKILLKFPGETTIDQILSFLKDPYLLNRAEVCKFLPNILGDEAVAHLKPMLRDEVWWVSLQAGLSLRRVGDKGTRILKQLLHDEEEAVRNVSEYVLSLPVTHE